MNGEPKPLTLESLKEGNLFPSILLYSHTKEKPDRLNGPAILKLWGKAPKALLTELLALADGGWARLLAALLVAAGAETEGYRCKRNDRRDLGDGHNKIRLLCKLVASY